MERTYQGAFSPSLGTTAPVMSSVVSGLYSIRYEAIAVLSNAFIVRIASDLTTSLLLNPLIVGEVVSTPGTQLSILE